MKGLTVACNDDACPNSTGKNVASRVTLGVQAGTTYFILVDGYGTASGDYRLLVTPPSTTPSATFRFTCPATVPVGTDVVVPLTATVVGRPLGAYSVRVNFDPTVLRITAIQGATSGFFTGTPTSNSGQWTSGSAQFNAFQTGSLTAPTGTVPLARITFHVVGGGFQPPFLGLVPGTVVDTNGVTLSVPTPTSCP